MQNAPLVFEQVIEATPGEIWNAITVKEQMKEWYFDLAEFKPQPGFHFQFEGGTEVNKYIHHCTIQEAIQNKRLSYTWSYEGYEGESLVIFDIFPQGNNTLLRLSHEGLETFPSNNPDLARHNFEAGWKHIIGTSLTEYLAGKKV
jgi:uncharacterized protein YndB with AHSA1/START domain